MKEGLGIFYCIELCWDLFLEFISFYLLREMEMVVLFLFDVLIFLFMFIFGVILSK